LHIKKNDRIVFTNTTSGERKTYKVYKVEEWEHDQNYMRVTFPEVTDKQGFQIEPGSVMVYHKDEQVHYMENR